MTRQLNPFIFGRPIPPSHFIGRDEIINRCYSRLAGPVRSSIAISGEHGIGKTSLLHYLIHLAEAESWGNPYSDNIFIYLDCQTVKQFTQTRFWRRVLETLQEADKISDLTIIKELLAQPELDATHIQRLLRHLHQQGQALVLLLDSFTWIVKPRAEKTDNEKVGNFLSSLRALANQPHYALTMVTATRQHLDSLCYEIVKDRPGSRFYNNFTFESLAPFTPEETEELLQRAMKKGDTITFAGAERDLLAWMAGTHPTLFQIAGSHIFEARRAGSLSPEICAKITAEFEKSARHHFNILWQDASPTEQALFVAVILTQLNQVASIQLSLSPEDITRLLYKYERNLNYLLERGLLRQTGQGYQIFSAVFSAWIVSEVATAGENAKTFRDSALLEIWQALERVAPQLSLDSLTQKFITRSTLLEGNTVIPARYDLQQELGRGANGVIYKAFDTHLTRSVAIKLLHSYKSASQDMNRRLLLKEARAASQLQHPNIVTIYDVVQEGDEIFLVMEYLEGQTLAKLLEMSHRLSLAQVIPLVEQAAAALDYAHAHNVIHRDIKPANLMISGDNTLKLTDFGIAKITNDPQTTFGAGLKGTVLYMSPEQINQRSLDGRSDLFSLASVAFEMLCGEPPWQGVTYLELMNHISRQPPRSPADFYINGGLALEPVFAKAFAKDPAYRYQTGAEFVRDLKETALVISG